MQSADFLSAVFFYLKVGENLNQNWIVENLNNAFSTWNGKLGELWGLVTTGPQTFKGGAVWSVMQTLHNGMVGIGYRGTDIPAPEGTPILAAHSGTVLVSGWNDSYGNQVLLDNGAGLSTRYAHMTQTAVTAGEAVTAGQIIGYVGSTGDSTGNHLHFEVMQNGVRMNPLELVFAQ